MRSQLRYRVARFAVLLLLLGNLYVGYDSQRTLSGQFEQLAQAKDDLQLLKDVENFLLSVETGQRGYLLTEESSYLAPYNDAVTQLDDAMRRLEARVADRPRLASLATELDHAIDAKTSESAATLALADAGDFAAAIAIVDEDLGQDQMEAFRAVSAAMEAAFVTTIDSLELTAARARTRALIVLAIAGLVSIALLWTLIVAGSRHALQTEEMNRHLAEQNEHLDELVRSRTHDLEVVNQQFVRSNRELESFAYVVSHDLQEPLRKIRAFGDRLEARHGDDLDPKAIDYIGRMQAAAQRMSTLLSDLLAFSRVNTKGLKLVEVDLSKLVDTVLDDLELGIVKKSAEIEVTELPVVTGDETQLRQLFQNLISNALKFQAEGNVPKISIAGTVENSPDDRAVAILTVRDNGIGFEERFLEKIFDPFQRLHGRSAYSGSGIGLAICRRIAERHGGSITASSVPGEGSVFTVTLDTSLSDDDLRLQDVSAKDSIDD